MPQCGPKAYRGEVSPLSGRVVRVFQVIDMDSIAFRPLRRISCCESNEPHSLHNSPWLSRLRYSWRTYKFIPPWAMCAAKLGENCKFTSGWQRRAPWTGGQDVSHRPIDVKWSPQNLESLPWFFSVSPISSMNFISLTPTSGDRVSAVVLRPAHIFGSYNDLDFVAADVLAGPV